MELELDVALGKIIESYGERHGASQILIHLFDSSSKWHWCKPIEETLLSLDHGQLKPEEKDSLSLNHGEKLLLESDIKTLHSKNEILVQKEDQIHITTPLISRVDLKLLGYIQSEFDKPGLERYVEEYQIERDPETDRAKFWQCVPTIQGPGRKALGEIISTLLVDGPLWGLRSLGKVSELLYSAEETLQKFMDHFETIRKKPKHDEWDARGRDPFASKVLGFIQSLRPIPMVLPAFPFKSSNTTHKVISRHADKAEQLALDALSAYCAQVRQYYPPGVSLVLVSDGRVYNSQFEIDLELVLAFQREVKLMNRSPDIRVVGLGDFLPETEDRDMRRALLALFGQPMHKIDEILKTNADFNRVYVGFKKFMAEELPFPPDITAKQRNLRCAGAAREMMKSNDAYGKLVECIFPNHMRLSIHAHCNVTKIGINMVSMTPGSDMQWGTPWHNCALLRKSGTWELIRKNMAQVRGYLIQQTPEGLPYYLETDPPIPPEAPPHPLQLQVFIGDILQEVEELEVQEFCALAGKVKELDYLQFPERPFAHAFVSFESPKEAEWAVVNLNGASLCGGVVRVQFPKKLYKKK